MIHLLFLMLGQQIGTLFLEETTSKESRKRWLLSEERKGTIYVDAGAATKIMYHGASLLASGITRLAKSVSFQMAATSLQQRNNAFSEIITNIKKYQDSILTANFQDITLAQANGLNEALIDRLSLENRLEGIIHDIKQVISFPDPIGEKFDEQTNLSNKLHLIKYRVPLGVLGVIYESRPNVTIDIGTLTIKSGNCALLRGGSETLQTNKVLIEIIQNP